METITKQQLQDALEVYYGRTIDNPDEFVALEAKTAKEHASSATEYIIGIIQEGIPA